MRVAALQSDIVWEQPDANYARVEPWLRAAAAANARLVVLPEMFATGFSMNTARTSEPVGGPTTQFLADQAKQHDLWVCGSLAEQPEGAPLPFNTFLLAGPEGQVHRYRKLHPFSAGREHTHFAAGTEALTVEVEGIRFSPFICYDLRFADRFWAVALATDCYLVPANWPVARRHHWTTLLRARAIENQAYVIGCNRVGEGGGLAYSGDSRMIDPMGEELATAAGAETLLVADIDPAAVAETRERLPFLRDRQ